MRLALDRFEQMLEAANPYLHDPHDDELFHLILRDKQRDGRERPRLAAWIDRLDALPRA